MKTLIKKGGKRVKSGKESTSLLLGVDLRSIARGKLVLVGITLQQCLTSIFYFTIQFLLETPDEENSSFAKRVKKESFIVNLPISLLFPSFFLLSLCITLSILFRLFFIPFICHSFPQRSYWRLDSLYSTFLTFLLPDLWLSCTCTIFSYSYYVFDSADTPNKPLGYTFVCSFCPLGLTYFLKRRDIGLS